MTELHQQLDKLSELSAWKFGHWTRRPQAADILWHRSDPVEDFLSPPTLEGQLNISGERLSQQIELTRTALGTDPRRPSQQAVH